MNKEDIIDIINNTYSPLSSKSQKELLTNMRLLNLKKDSILVKEGQYSDKVYFIIHGCARAYYLKDGKDISDWFAFEKDFICPIVSFFTAEPSPHYIELLEDAVLMELSRDDIEKLSNKHHDFERLIRVVVTKTMLSQHERMVSIQFQKAEKRYEKTLEIHPNITRRVSLTHIASYLGITLETLSRIRNPKNRI